MSQLGLLWEIKHFIIMNLGTELPIVFHSDPTHVGVGAFPSLHSDPTHVGVGAFPPVFLDVCYLHHLSIADGFPRLPGSTVRRLSLVINFTIFGIS